MPLDALTEPLRVILVEGEVVFLGPGAVNFAMTPAAARQTLERLSAVLAPDGAILPFRSSASS